MVCNWYWYDIKCIDKIRSVNCFNIHTHTRTAGVKRFTVIALASYYPHIFSFSLCLSSPVWSMEQLLNGRCVLCMSQFFKWILTSPRNTPLIFNAIFSCHKHYTHYSKLVSQNSSSPYFYPLILRTLSLLRFSSYLWIVFFFLAHVQLFCQTTKINHFE